MITPRLISGKEAAAYCGITLATWCVWVSKGIMPKPVPATRRWDRNAIDAKLDALAGIESSRSAEQMAEDNWERKFEARL